MKKQKLFSILLILVLILSAFIVACDKEDEKITISVGEYYTWQAGSGYTYSSSDENIASIDADGKILGVNAGECTVSAVKPTNKQTLKVKVVAGKSGASSSSLSSQSSTSSFISSNQQEEQSNQSNIDNSSQGSSSEIDQYNYFTATCKYEGVDYTVKAKEGYSFSKPNIQIDNGYFIHWFIDSAFTTSYNFATEATEDITIYGKKYKELTKSFFGYENNKVTEINSLEDFQYYLEYTSFNQITDDNYVIDNIGIKEMLEDSNKRSELINKSTCPFIELAYSIMTSSVVKIEVRVTETVPQTFLTQSGKGTLTQVNYLDYSQDKAFKSSRGVNFDEFAYNELAEEVSVYNSNQLFFALEHGVKPIPVAGSNAEIALNKCKAILRDICDDSMSEYEKVLAIYKYLIMNTEYVLPNEKLVTNALKYDAYYMEGVLNNGAAVCDGIAKTLSALCNIEGIRCVRTASTNHAWNEVFVNGKWFAIDATHGNLEVGESYEVLSYSNFLINEEIKEDMKAQEPYVDYLRTDVIADGEFNYYSQDVFTYKGQDYDYVMSNQGELTALMSYCLEVANLSSYESFTVEFLADFNVGILAEEVISNALLESRICNRFDCFITDLTGTMSGRSIYIIRFC